jgi:diaminopropionate ammonia-lyase
MLAFGKGFDSNMTEPYGFYENPRSMRRGCTDASEFSSAMFEAARKEISSWPNYQPTPLISLSGLARAKGVGTILYKDEGSRFGLGSFKALGGAYAVCRVLQAAILDRMGMSPSSEELRQGRFRNITETITVATATDGNHGRSVAWGANQFYCRCVVYVPNNCSRNRELAIARYGAQVVRSAVGYDETVHQCLQDAEARGWLLISDRSWGDNEKIPATVMQGYTVMTREVLDQLAAAKRPTHVFVQAGVGGLAGAVCAFFSEVWEVRRPRMIVVEPSGAACMFASALAGKRVSLDKVQSIMVGLESGEASPLAWRLLEQGTDFFITVPDSAVPDCMRLLAASPYADPPIVAGESAVAGLAGLLYLLDDPALRTKLELDSTSSILLFGTEADTDPDLYSKLVGMSADQVRRRADFTEHRISDSRSSLTDASTGSRNRVEPYRES